MPMWTSGQRMIFNTSPRIWVVDKYVTPLLLVILPLLFLFIFVLYSLFLSTLSYIYHQGTVQCLHQQTREITGTISWPSKEVISYAFDLETVETSMFNVLNLVIVHTLHVYMLVNDYVFELINSTL